jgi:hypothetical protein
MNYYILKHYSRSSINGWYLEKADEQDILKAEGDRLVAGNTIEEAAEAAVIDKNSPVYSLRPEKYSFADLERFRFVTYKGCPKVNKIKSAKSYYPRTYKQAFTEHLKGQWYDSDVPDTKINRSLISKQKMSFYWRSGLIKSLNETAEKKRFPKWLDYRLRQAFIDNIAKDKQLLKLINKLNKVIFNVSAENSSLTYLVNSVTHPYLVNSVTHPILHEFVDYNITIKDGIHKDWCYCAQRYSKNLANHKNPYKCSYYWDVIPFAWFIKHFKPNILGRSVSVAICDALYWQNPDQIEELMSPLWKSVSSNVRKEMTEEVIKININDE